MKRFFGTLLVLFFASLTAAFAAESGVIQIETPWARESPPAMENGAAYMTLVNTGKEADRLISASGDVAKTIELHTHLHENNVMVMRKVDAIEITPGKPTQLQPGGLHIMLIGLKKPLVAGQTFPLTLKFEKAGEATTQVIVRGKDASTMTMPEGHGAMSGGHGTMPEGHGHPHQ